MDRRRKGSTRRVHRVACLAGDGLGPELMAEATRALRKVARMHGFAIEDVHAPIGTEALTRSGQPLPAATLSAVLGADAVLVADAAEPALAELRAQLDLRARLTHVLFRAGAASRSSRRWPATARAGPSSGPSRSQSGGAAGWYPWITTDAGPQSSTRRATGTRRSRSSTRGSRTRFGR